MNRKTPDNKKVFSESAYGRMDEVCLRRKVLEFRGSLKKRRWWAEDGSRPKSNMPLGKD